MYNKHRRASIMIFVYQPLTHPYSLFQPLRLLNSQEYPLPQFIPSYSEPQLFDVRECIRIRNAMDDPTLFANPLIYFLMFSIIKPVTHPELK